MWPFRSVTSAAAVLALAAGVAAAGQTVTLGQTFPIAEPDALAQIEERAAGADWKAKMGKPMEQHSAFQSATLRYASVDAERMFDPTYTLPHDIVDGAGLVIYPAGTTINVYARITMPGRVIVIGPEAAHFRWLADVVKPTAQDVVLLANGNPLAVRAKHELPVYLLDARMIERFGLRAAPAVVAQNGTMLKVKEYAIPLD